MPPHARMSLAQQLLLLALVARFWHEPYRGSLVRWGTQLHDRFMLPHFVWQDFTGIVADMNDAGYALDSAWFAPHFEFRFPLCGQHRLRSDVSSSCAKRSSPGTCSARKAPSAAPCATSTPRSSACRSCVSGFNARTLSRRLQRRARAADAARAARRVSSAACGFAPGSPPSSLHPTIPVDAPLVFDLYDRWSGRAVAGCTYHVAHPGGRNFERFPVNAYEAESRRLARFFAVRPHARALPGAGTTPSARISLHARPALYALDGDSLRDGTCRH